MYKKTEEVKKSGKIYLDIKRSFFTIVLVTILFNFFISGILNIKSQTNSLENINFVSAELQNNIPVKEKGEIEKYLLNIPEIKKVIYVDSYIAFRNLQSNLGIVIPRRENPLSDSLRIYFDNKSSLEKIQNILDQDKRIKEYFIDGNYSDKINSRLKLYSLVKNIFIFGAIFSLIILYTIINLQIQGDYLVLIINNKTFSSKFKTRAKNINLLHITFSILGGSTIYYNFYFLLRKWVLKIEPQLFILSIFQIIYIQSLISLFLIILIWKIPIKKKSEKL